MFVTPKGKRVLRPQQRKVYGPFFFIESTITSIVYLDMLQQFLIPQLDEDDQDRRIHSSKTEHPLIALEKCASTSAPVSLVGG
jgi:hypothetical protein